MIDLSLKAVTVHIASGFGKTDIGKIYRDAEHGVGQ
jgi:hypothetical protein